jgi:hypothetical protein
MAKKSVMSGENILFDVIYVDGSQRSNRRVPADLLGGLDGDEPALTEIMRQDREISEKSGMAPVAIKSLKRTGAKPERVSVAARRGKAAKS